MERAHPFVCKKSLFHKLHREYGSICIKLHGGIGLVDAIPMQKKSGIPLLGLGTWNLRGHECEETVKRALEMGYRYIDTADAYENHAAIGRAIKAYPRKDLFLVSKL